MDPPQATQVPAVTQVLTPLPYFEETAPTLLPIIRAIGTIAIVLGALEIGTFPLSVLATAEHLHQRQLVTPYLVWSTIVSFAIYAVLAMLLVFCGVQCVRRLPRARSTFVMWAYAQIVYSIYFIIANVFYVGVYYPRGVSQIASLGESVRHGLSSISLAIVIVILFRQPRIAALFVAAAAGSRR